MRKRSIAATSVALLGFCLWLPAEANAAPRGGDGFGDRGFVYGSPGIIAIPMEEEDFLDLDVTWQWSVGGGYMWNPAKHFMITAGGALEHMIYNFDTGAVEGNMLRLTPETRIGGGTRQFFGYGRLAPGLALSIVEVDVPVFGDEDDTDAGFNLGLGAGFQALVWRGLMVGGELDFDLTFMNDDECDDNCDDDYALHTFGLKFIIGYYF